MGTAGLVLGIIALLLSWIPIISIIAFILALIGLILSIIDTVKKNKINDPNKGVSIAGIVTSALAFITSASLSFVFIITLIVAMGEAINSEDFRDSINRIEDDYYEWHDKYDVDHYLDDFYYDYDFNL